ncbi:DUF4136 domain-containing protein [Psychromonas hadalis]|uniref:DUF4136 domain-containing protein n=1 Tax=Psychromonas hadalis TaxID=211669 RepID=UPI0003B7AAF4|nr:DUF4136 domain-containing protein [Psychromonas hadalis]
MKKMVLMLSLITSFFIITGCSSSVEQAQQERKAKRMTVVSSAKPADVLPAFTSFTWSKEYSHVLSTINDGSERELHQYIRGEIIRYLKTKGYVYQPDPIQADVVIGYLFALEDDLADQKIQQKFGLLPGVNSRDITDKRYEKGSFLLAVLDTKLGQVYWRSAMQGFVDFEKDRSDTETNNMQIVLGMMMGGFPKAGR